MLSWFALNKVLPAINAYPTRNAAVRRPASFAAWRRCLEQGEVHVWVARAAAVVSLDLERSYAESLSEPERIRATKFLFAKDRVRYLVTRTLVRSTLSRYVPVAPREWRFRTNQYGRPEIAAPATSAMLRFSVSHTEGLVAVAIARDRDIGIDVEHLGRPISNISIVAQTFAGVEFEALNRIPSGDRKARFLEYWTLKESYVKARGIGLSMPLSRVRFDLAGSDIVVSLDGDLGDDESRWQFSLFRPTAQHVLAVAAENRSRKAAGVRVLTIHDPPTHQGSQRVARIEVDDPEIVINNVLLG